MDLNELKNYITTLVEKNQMVEARNTFLRSKAVKRTPKTESGKKLALEFRYLKYEIQRKLRLHRRLKTLDKIMSTGDTLRNLSLKFQELKMGSKKITEKIRQEMNNVKVKILNSPRKSAWDYCAIGIIHSHLQDYYSAELDFQKSVELQPDFLEPMLGLKRIYAWRNDQENQLIWINKLLEICPHYYRSLKSKCFLMSKQNKHAEALQTIETMKKFDCHMGDRVKMTEADSYFKTEQYVKAREMYLSLMQSSKNKDINFNLAIAKTYMAQKMYTSVRRANCRASSG